MLNSKDERQSLRRALLTAVAFPNAAIGWDPSSSTDEIPEVLLGVLASDARLAVRALRDYCTALNVPFFVPESRVPNAPTLPAIQCPVYIKYNSRSGLCYASAYDGRDRGVLVQFGRSQVGHLPLGLLDEDMTRPPPRLDAEPQL